TAFATGDARAAETLEALLAPYARLSAVAGSGLLYYGSVSHHLGLLALTRRDWNGAITHFESALAAEEKIGARVWTTRTLAAGARALLGRHSPMDLPRAAKLLSEAVATARSHGLVEVSESVRDLEAAIWSRRPRVPRARRASTE